MAATQSVGLVIEEAALHTNGSKDSLFHCLCIQQSAGVCAEPDSAAATLWYGVSAQ